MIIIVIVVPVETAKLVSIIGPIGQPAKCP